MAKSIKLENDIYLDSSCIIHNTKQLQYTTNLGITYPYRKLLEVKLPDAYDTVFLKFVVAETENIGFIFNGELIAHVSNLKTIATFELKGSYSFNFIGTDVKFIFYCENNTAGNVTLSLYCYCPYNWRTLQFEILSGFNIKKVTLTTNVCFDAEPTYVSKKEVNIS